jgi:uncharacterized SAM-binding protein YcdF (DUF218 family)
MFFLSAKLLHFLLRPSNAILIVVLFGGIALTDGATTFGAICLSFGLALSALIAWTPLPYWLLRPLEEAQPHFNPDKLDPSRKVGGIILLGGGVNAGRGDRPNGPIFTSAGSRLITTLELAHRFPAATILLSGGTPNLRRSKTASEAALTRDLLIRLGIEPRRIQVEETSRDTFENARESSVFLTASEDSWLLVTSAAHMPRALATFGDLATKLIPCCADYKTQGTLDDDRYFGSAAFGLLCCDTAVHEWLGLIAYRLSGRIGQLPRFRSRP